MTQNKYVLSWIEEMKAMTQPDQVVWIDGSEAQAEALRAEACSTGEMIKLNEKELPNCYLHRTAINDVARVENRTFICTSKKEDAGNINNWNEECYALTFVIFQSDARCLTPSISPSTAVLSLSITVSSLVPFSSTTISLA